MAANVSYKELLSPSCLAGLHASTASFVNSPGRKTSSLSLSYDAPCVLFMEFDSFRVLSLRRHVTSYLLPFGNHILHFCPILLDGLHI